jgi:hypothetical protein
MSTIERQQLSASLDLPPRFGGVGLQSLVRAAYEELLGSWASVTTILIAFFRTKGLLVFDKLTNALDTMASEDSTLETPVIRAVASLLAVSARTQTFLADISVTKMNFATNTIMGERLIEIPRADMHPWKHQKSMNNCPSRTSEYLPIMHVQRANTNARF